MNLWLTNTLTKSKELVIPHDHKHIKMYVCGITPYDRPHLGHGRVYVTFDIVYRLLMLLGYDVTYVRNFTDIDDKIIDRAAKELCLPQDIAQRYMKIFHENMQKLNCLAPTHEPLVTEYIQEIIDFIEKLIATGKAYQVGGDIYYDITQFAAYGKLSKRTLDDQEAGARVAVNQDKRNSGDFALWKGNNNQEFWQSPWGFGRPGWHIECSVMAHEKLGETIDIHGGGLDLIFPHHENEIAQSEGLFNKPFSRVWMHNAFITIHKEKMSKSLGNFITLEDAFKSVDPMIMRFYLLQHHYRKPIDFSDVDLRATEVAYKRIAHSMKDIPVAQTLSLSSVEHHAHALIEMLIEALCDDLNTPKFLGIFFEHLNALSTDKITMSQVKFLFVQVLGLSLDYQADYMHKQAGEPDMHVQKKIAELILLRDQARTHKDWKLADSLREQLRDLGYEVQDKK